MAAFRLAVTNTLRVFAAKSGHIAPSQPVYAAGFNYLTSSCMIAPLHRTLTTVDSIAEDPLPPRSEYIESQDPEEWKFVERLLPPTVVPEPTPKTEYPSGWSPQTEDAAKLPYYIGRSKNHMPSVYLWIGHRGIGKRTFIKKIKGDIWELEQELQEYLKAKTGKPRIPSQVNEMCGSITFKGDHVLHCLDWVKSKGL